MESSKNKVEEYFPMQRKATMYDETNLHNQIKTLEDEIRQLKAQNEQFKSSVEALEAEKLQKSLEKGKPIANMSISTKEESLASEIVTESKDEVNPL